ncbi:MAG: hypothetical protein GF334_08330 [Candidatus Altiarchaeales archaeon]|nr:hypothetical protein [Candidatus Altiarchaeales archaeon]
MDRIQKIIWSSLIVLGLLVWMLVFISVGSTAYGLIRFMNTVENPNQTMDSPPKTTSEGALCTAPHMKYEDYCCLDADENTVCDFLQTTSTATSTTKTTSTTTSTSLSTTTTLHHCLNGVRDGGELLVDCAGECRSACDVLELNKSKARYFRQTSFTYTGFRLVDEGVEYHIEINSEDVSDEIALLPGETGYFDDVSYKILEGDNMRLKVKTYMNPFWVNTSKGRLLLIGGSNCHLGGGFCERTYNGYTIRLMDRGTQKYHIDLADNTYSIVILEDKIDSPDSELALKTVKKYLQGGYSIIHVWMV